MLSIYRAGEIDLFENLHIVHITLLVETTLALPERIWSNVSHLEKEKIDVQPYMLDLDPQPSTFSNKLQR